MIQQNYIKDIIRFGLENNQNDLRSKMTEYIQYNKDNKKIKFGLELQEILKSSSIKYNKPTIHFGSQTDKEIDNLIIQYNPSEYTMDNLVLSKFASEQLDNFVREHKEKELLTRFNLPLSNKLLLNGPSGCGKTMTAYVVAGELKKKLIIVNLGSIVSSKLGETSKNLSNVFRMASQQESIIFIDEFDSLGKVRNYDQDHGEMKRIVNSIIQLFDYLPQSSIIIAATNQKKMIDDALLRRFDTSITLELPEQNEMERFIDIILKDKGIGIDDQMPRAKLLETANGLPYASIQQTLINSIKRSILASMREQSIKPKVNTLLWHNLLKSEKIALNKES